MEAKKKKKWKDKQISIVSFYIYMVSAFQVRMGQNRTQKQYRFLLFPFYPQTFCKSEWANNWTWKSCKNCNSNRKKEYVFLQNIAFHSSRRKYARLFILVLLLLCTVQYGLAGCRQGFPQPFTRASLFVRAIRRCFWVCWVKSSI